MAMIVILIGAAAIVLIDQALKLCVARYLPENGVWLGRLGKIRVAERRIWLSPQIKRFGAASLWAGWLAGAGILVVLSWEEPVNAFFSALLLGGSASHAVEMSRRGSVRDYVWLRFWPGFNFADVAITLGAIGLATILYGQGPFLQFMNS